MNNTIALFAEIRTEVGTGSSRALRNAGRVPGIIYGSKDKAPIAVSIEEKEITKYYRKPNFIATVFELEIGDKKYKVLPKAVDLHPITDVVHHIDFVHLNEDTQKLQVPIVYEGKDRALGVKRGGFFNIVKRTVALLCDANNIPKNITIDVTNMRVGQSLKFSDLKLPNGASIVGKTSGVIATIIGSRGSKSDEEGASSAGS
jgi:large subunit ribosomal protein L25